MGIDSQNDDRIVMTANEFWLVATVTRWVNRIIHSGSVVFLFFSEISLGFRRDESPNRGHYRAE
jgi:hypothetical protein